VDSDAVYGDRFLPIQTLVEAFERVRRGRYHQRAIKSRTYFKEELTDLVPALPDHHLGALHLVESIISIPGERVD
jgi:hypothetical protein